MSTDLRDWWMRQSFEMQHRNDGWEGRRGCAVEEFGLWAAVAGSFTFLFSLVFSDFGCAPRTATGISGEPQ
jgi:hypothetical protein